MIRQGLKKISRNPPNSELDGGRMPKGEVPASFSPLDVIGVSGELSAHGSDGAEPSSDHHADSRRRIAAKMAAAAPASENVQAGTSCNA